MHSTTALFVTALLATASAMPSPERVARRATQPVGYPAYPAYQPKEYYQNYYPHAYHNYLPYLATKPQFLSAYERQQEYDAAISASENENANSNENLAGAKSENANENANLAKGGEAFGFGALESDNRNLLANENNIEVANANKNELGVEVSNFNANENTAQQESAALAEVQNEDMALFEDFLENDNENYNDNVNDNCDSCRPCVYPRPAPPPPCCNKCGNGQNYGYGYY